MKEGDAKRGGGWGGKKRKGTRKRGQNITPVITPRKDGVNDTTQYDSTSDGDAPGRGGIARPTPDRSASKARRSARLNEPATLPNESTCSDPICATPSTYEQRNLAQGGKGGRHPSVLRPADRGWNEENLNIGERRDKKPIQDGVEYDPLYQRLKGPTVNYIDDDLPTHQQDCSSRCAPTLEGNRIVDITNLTSFLSKKTACRKCATAAAVQVAFDFANLLDKEEGLRTRSRSGPSFCERLQRYLRQCGGHAAAVNIPSFTPVGEANLGFASTIHFMCSGSRHSCDLGGKEFTKKGIDGEVRPISRFSSHRISLSTSRRTSLLSQHRWPRHPRSAVEHSNHSKARLDWENKMKEEMKAENVRVEVIMPAIAVVSGTDNGSDQGEDSDGSEE